MCRRTLAASIRVETDLANGEQALALLRYRVQVDLLLADIVMPGDLQGPEPVETARAEKPGLKAVMITGYAKVRDEGESVRVLTKPILRQELQQVIGEMLDDIPV